MAIELTQDQQNALKWGFERNNAQWIVSVRDKAHSESTIRSAYISYVQSLLDAEGGLTVLEEEYLHASDKNAASSIIALAGKEYIPPRCLERVKS